MFFNLVEILGFLFFTNKLTEFTYYSYINEGFNNKFKSFFNKIIYIS